MAKEIQRKKLQTVLGTNAELMDFSYSKIYTCHSNDLETWYDSNLEGILCYIIEKRKQSKSLVLYDIDSLQLLFKHEIYKDFHMHYQVITDHFHCFESNNGFIGIKFFSEKSGHLFSLIVKKIDDNITQGIFKEIKVIEKKENENSYLHKIERIKNIFQKRTTINKDFDEKYIIEDFIILKAKYFNFFYDFKFDKQERRFLIGNIPPEVKHVFSKLGIKKSDFKDTGFVLRILKELIHAVVNPEEPEIKNKEIRKVPFLTILLTKDLDSIGHRRSLAYRKSICSAPKMELNQNNRESASNNENFKPMKDMIMMYSKKSVMMDENEKLPLEKKTLFNFPKIPNILHQKINEEHEKTNIDYEIQNFKFQNFLSCDKKSNYSENLSNFSRRTRKFNTFQLRNIENTLIQNVLHQTKRSVLDSDEDSNSDEWSD